MDNEKVGMMMGGSSEDKVDVNKLLKRMGEQFGSLSIQLMIMEQKLAESRERCDFLSKELEKNAREKVGNSEVKGEGGKKDG